METNSRKSQVCLSAWLESVSLFSPGWPWTPCLGFLRPLDCYLMYTTNPGSKQYVSAVSHVSQWLRKDVQYVVTESTANAGGSPASYPGHLLFVTWYQHLLLLRISFCFVLVLRSGDRWGRAALEDTCTWNQVAEHVPARCGYEWKACSPPCGAPPSPVELRRALWSWGAAAFTTWLLMSSAWGGDL